MRNWEPMTPLQPLRPPLTFPPPPNHPILLLSIAFKNAIKENRIYALKALSKQFIHQLETNLEFITYDHSDLATCYQTAEDIINSLSTTTAENPTLVQQPRASFKPPKPTTYLHEDTLTFEMNPITPLHEDTLIFEMNPTTPLHEDTLPFEMNPTTHLHEDTLTFEMNPTTPLQEDTLTFEMKPTTPLHEDSLTFKMNPTTPLHEDTLTFEINPTTPLHEDTLTFEMNSATPLHEDTSNGQPPETPHQEVQRCTRNTPCKLPGCMICQTPTKPGSSNSLVSPTYPNPPIEPDPLSNPEVPTNPLEPDPPTNPNPTTNPALPIDPDPLAKPARPIEPDPQPHLGLHRSEESSSSSEFQIRVCSG